MDRPAPLRAMSDSPVLRFVPYDDEDPLALARGVRNLLVFAAAVAVLLWLAL